APARLNPRLPRDLEIICLKCLEKEPGRRYGSAGELADDLHRFRGGEPIRARPVGRWERAAKWARRRPAAAALAASLCLAALSLAGAGLGAGLYHYADLKARYEQARADQAQARAEQQEASEGRRRATARTRCQALLLK